MAASEMIKFVDVTKCDGCKACMVACKSWNDLPAHTEKFIGYQSHEKLTAYTWNLITFTENANKKQNAGLDWLLAHSSCHHCEEAGCEKACPEDAISHTKWGSVVIDHEKCVGCGYCVSNCTFDVVQLGKITDKNGKEKEVAMKCVLCTDRLDAGLRPACVTACHTGSLEFGKRDDIMKEAVQRLSVMKDRYPNASIYNTEGVGSTTTVYLLADKPELYGLPANPKIPSSITFWKDYAQPAGKLLMGATAMAVVTGVVTNKIFNPRAKGGQADVQEHE